MNGSGAARKPEGGDSHPVVFRVARTVCSAEHIAVLSDGRTYVLLSEFNENFRLDGFQS